MSKHKREERSTWGEVGVVVDREDHVARAKHEDFVQKHRREGGSITTSCVNNSWYLLLDPQGVTESTSRVFVLYLRERSISFPLAGKLLEGCNGYGPGVTLDYVLC